MTVADILYESLGFHTDDDESGDLEAFCAAWATPLEGVYDLVRERDDQPGWAILFDADEAPVESLPYLAQWVGVLPTPEMSAEQLREEIKAPTGWSRGTEPSIEVVGKRSLTGSQKLVIKPRTPEAGVIYIRSLASETPDEERTRRDLRAAVPAWTVLDYDAYDGATYSDIDAAHATYAEVDEAFDSYDELLQSSLP
jgi:hypothetical protein